jgi:hypothetical protein
VPFDRLHRQPQLPLDGTDDVPALNREDMTGDVVFRFLGLSITESHIGWTTTTGIYKS